MRDVFLVYEYHDEVEAAEIGRRLAARGLDVGPPVSLWTEMRVLPRVDLGLSSCRRCLVLVSAHFLKLNLPPRELDGLSSRRNVVSLLHGVAEEDVAEHSRRLAVSAIPGTMIEQLVKILRSRPEA